MHTLSTRMFVRLENLSHIRFLEPQGQYQGNLTQNILGLRLDSFVQIKSRTLFTKKIFR